MKIGVSSYSFHKYKNATGCDLFKIIDKAKEIGFNGIEFLNMDYYCAKDDDKLELAKKLKAYCDEKQIEIPAYTVTSNLLADNVDEVVEGLFRNIDIAEALGAPLMRHDVTFALKKEPLYTYKTAIAEMVPHIRRVADYAESKGIRTCMENHGRVFQHPRIVEELILAVNHKNFGWLVDMGNFVGVDVDPSDAFAIAAPYAFHVHAKDILWKKGTEIQPDGFSITNGGNYNTGTVLGYGMVPIQSCINALTRVGYEGYVSLEFEGLEECLPAIQAGYNYLKKVVK